MSRSKARLADNTLHPLQIEDARDAAFKASEAQREVEGMVAQAALELAEAERAYRRALTTRMLQLHAGGLAITTCEVVAKGEVEVSDLRYARDIAKGRVDAVRQQAYRRGADRRSIDRLLEWSQHRDLRTDTPPPRGVTP